MYDLWDEASRDVEAENRQRRVASKKIAVASMWPFLANATSTEEFDLRLEMAFERIASSAGDDLPEILAALRTDFELLQESRDFKLAAVPQVGEGVEGEAAAESDSEPEEGLGPLHVAVLKVVTAAGEKFIIVDEESGYKIGGPFNDHGEAVSALGNPKFKGREVKVEKQSEGEEAEKKEKASPGKEAPKTKEHKPRLKGGAPKARAAAKFPPQQDDEDEGGDKPPF